MANYDTDIKLSALSKSLLKTLMYFDVFNYPLNIKELISCCDYKEKPNTKDGKASLEELVAQELIYEFDDFYTLHNKQDLIDRRLKGNQLAKERMKDAHKMTRLIASFPYVRAVMLSGSISKDFMEDDSDIDFFIITEPQRLWIARTLLILFKKTFLLNSYKNFCINYLIDSEHLEIEHQNIYTGIELLTLIPTYGGKIYDELIDANPWSKKYYPNYQKRSTKEVHEFKKGTIQKISEGILNTKLGEWIDSYFMKITMNFWQKKYKSHQPEHFETSIRSRKYVSKYHPNDFQQKVLNLHKQKIKDFESKYNVSL